MRNTESTKEKILSVSAGLFNVQGFKATSLSDITTATGLTKGAIYRHFADKNDLEEKSFVYISLLIQKEFSRVIKNENNAPDKLRAICHFFLNYIHSPIIQGGCPILNAGVESDDTKPFLNQKVIELLDSLQFALQKIIQKGIEYGQIKKNTDPLSFSTVFIAALEGGVLLSKLRKQHTDIKRVIAHLQLQIDLISN
ncbi:TetR/AcrR family transcriptional regulator [Marivirga sp. S37H4]|uniref:TetR/AcrR family transcriptional regulator n=1 Tax=Marivirga aurantiaca TaxID=2802615 RepID=A0A935CAG1_9BACT|nr:TetR/AcrR family transcriptional regulator [Marivirga aurantiaca]MBK6266575.1 TetR/AcrR family transcriptional regulator [Marivirga aurantiaca]